MRGTSWCGLAFVLSTWLVPACKKSEPSYERFCHLYEEVEGRPMDSMLAMELTQRAEKEIPELAELLAGFYLGERYEALKTMAKEQGQPGWECKAIQKRLQEWKEEAVDSRGTRSAPRPSDGP